MENNISIIKNCIFEFFIFLLKSLILDLVKIQQHITMGILIHIRKILFCLLNMGILIQQNIIGKILLHIMHILF